MRLQHWEAAHHISEFADSTETPLTSRQLTALVTWAADGGQFDLWVLCSIPESVLEGRLQVLEDTIARAVTGLWLTPLVIWAADRWRLDL